MIIEILTIGNELLIGRVVNTNAAWLSSFVVRRGHKVSRITSIGDDENEIINEIHAALNRQPDAVVTVGGLGPTFDDMTSRSVAKGLGIPYELNGEALELITRKYQELGLRLTEERIKMAMMPKGAAALRNNVGTAPGFSFRAGKTLIVSLPGVPAEMKAIVESYADFLFPIEGELVEYTLVVSGLPESSAAPIFAKTVHDNPYVYVKSHPEHSEGQSVLKVHVYAITHDQHIKALCHTVTKRLKDDLMALGAQVQGDV